MDKFVSPRKRRIAVEGDVCLDYDISDDEFEAEYDDNYSVQYAEAMETDDVPSAAQQPASDDRVRRDTPPQSPEPADTDEADGDIGLCYQTVSCTPIKDVCTPVKDAYSPSKDADVSMNSDESRRSPVEKSSPEANKYSIVNQDNSSSTELDYESYSSVDERISDRGESGKVYSASTSSFYSSSDGMYSSDSDSGSDSSVVSLMDEVFRIDSQTRRDLNDSLCDRTLKSSDDCDNESPQSCLSNHRSLRENSVEKMDETLKLSDTENVDDLLENVDTKSNVCDIHKSSQDTNLCDTEMKTKSSDDGKITDKTQLKLSPETLLYKVSKDIVLKKCETELNLSLPTALLADTKYQCVSEHVLICRPKKIYTRRSSVHEIGRKVSESLIPESPSKRRSSVHGVQIVKEMEKLHNVDFSSPDRLTGKNDESVNTKISEKCKEGEHSNFSKNTKKDTEDVGKETKSQVREHKYNSSSDMAERKRISNLKAEKFRDSDDRESRKTMRSRVDLRNRDEGNDDYKSVRRARSSGRDGIDGQLRSVLRRDERQHTRESRSDKNVRELKSGDTGESGKSDRGDRRTRYDERERNDSRRHLTESKRDGRLRGDKSEREHNRIGKEDSRRDTKNRRDRSKERQRKDNKPQSDTRRDEIHESLDSERSKNRERKPRREEKLRSRKLDVDRGTSSRERDRGSEHCEAERKHRRYSGEQTRRAGKEGAGKLSHKSESVDVRSKRHERDFHKPREQMDEHTRSRRHHRIRHEERHGDFGIKLKQDKDEVGSKKEKDPRESTVRDESRKHHMNRRKRDTDIGVEKMTKDDADHRKERRRHARERKLQQETRMKPDAETKHRGDGECQKERRSERNSRERPEKVVQHVKEDDRRDRCMTKHRRHSEERYDRSQSDRKRGGSAPRLCERTKYMEQEKVHDSDVDKRCSREKQIKSDVFKSKKRERLPKRIVSDNRNERKFHDQERRLSPAELNRKPKNSREKDSQTKDTFKPEPSCSRGYPDVREKTSKVSMDKPEIKTNDSESLSVQEEDSVGKKVTKDRSQTDSCHFVLGYIFNKHLSCLTKSKENEQSPDIDKLECHCQLILDFLYGQSEEISDELLTAIQIHFSHIKGNNLPARLQRYYDRCVRRIDDLFNSRKMANIENSASFMTSVKAKFETLFHKCVSVLCNSADESTNAPSAVNSEAVTKSVPDKPAPRTTVLGVGLIQADPRMKLKRGNTLRNVLTRMQDIEGPVSVLYTALQERLRVKVWTRGARQLRGYCLGYIVAFDKYWNLAMVDVDEVYVKPYRKKPEEKQEQDSTVNPSKSHDAAESTTCDPPSSIHENIPPPSDTPPESAQPQVNPERGKADLEILSKKLEQFRGELDDLSDAGSSTLIGTKNIDEGPATQLDSNSQVLSQQDSVEQFADPAFTRASEVSSLDTEKPSRTTTEKNRDNNHNVEKCATNVTEKRRPAVGTVVPNYHDPWSRKTIALPNRWGICIERHVNQLFLRGDSVVSVGILD